MNIFFQMVCLVLCTAAFLPPLSLESNAADSSFIQTAELLASDKTTGNRFGTSIAISGDTILSGTPDFSFAGTSQGAVYVFVQDSATGVWQEKQKLVASDAAAGDFFGSSVALFGDTAFISARESKTQGSLSGAVYVFTRDANGQWQQQQKLTSSDGAAGRLFGASLTLTQNFAVIGAPGNASNLVGGAYVFAPDQNGQWQETQKLVASDSAASDKFGCSVATRDTSILLIGACANNTKGTAAGAAYLFVQDNNGNWKERQKLTAADGGAGQAFGSAVSFIGNTVFVGATSATGLSNNISGAVYQFIANADPPAIPTQWRIPVKGLIADDGANGDQFGSTLTATTDRLFIGAPGAGDKGTASGAVYFFAQTGGAGVWTQMQKFSARDETSGDKFAETLASQDDLIVAGAPFHSTHVTAADGTVTTYTFAGAFYVFSLTALPASCESKTDYDNAKCSGTFSVTSLSDLDDYVAQDFGRTDNKGKYQNLDISASLTDPHLVLQSPCIITLDNQVKLQGDFIDIDARGGIVATKGYQMTGKKACVLSENNNAGLGDHSVAEVDDLTIQAAKTAIIGKDASVMVSGDLLIKSTGTLKQSQALIDAGAIVTAGSIHLEAPGKVSFGTGATGAADGALILLSTGTTKSSQAFLGNGSQIQTTDLTLSAPSSAKIGKDSSVEVNGQLILETTSTASSSSVAVAKGTDITVAGNANLTSGGGAQISSQVVLSVDNELHIQAATTKKCKINKKATITAGVTSGNCF